MMSGTRHECSSSLATTSNKWHFLVMTFDRPSGYFRMYQLVEGSTQFTETMLYQVPESMSVYTKSNIRIGLRENDNRQIEARLYCYQIYKDSVTLAEAKSTS